MNKIIAKMKELANKNTNNNIIKAKDSKIKLMHDYLISNNNQISNTNEKNNKINKKSPDNIYIKYLKNPNIIFQNKEDAKNENLKSFFNEINQDIDKGNNILFPVLDFVPNLVKAYIESDLDNNNLGTKEENKLIEKSIYLKIFENLKNNCFISKEILFPIYDYFKELYNITVNSKELNESNIIVKKFNKIIKLFEIFYEPNKIKEKNLSSFCFIGGSMNIEFKEVLKISEINEILIKINNLKLDYIDHLKNEANLVKINDKEIKYKKFKEKINTQEIKIIKIIINENIKVEFDENNIGIIPKNKITEIKEISLFEEFYGQFSSIEITIIKDKNEIEYQFLPYSIRNNNEIYYFKKNIISSSKKKITNTNINPKIKINNKKLVGINYINYNDKQFNIIDYFGGVIQFLPFYQIFKNLEKNEEKYKSVTTKFINKEKINQFLNFLLKIVIKKIFTSNKKRKLFKKYACLIYYLLIDLDLDLEYCLGDYEDDKNCENINYFIEFLTMIFFNQKNIKNVNDLKNDIELRDNKDKTDLSFFVYPKETLNQLYKQYVKTLFCYNNLWSNKNIFYPKKFQKVKNDNEQQIKYKQLNCYTKNFQLPYFYPILEYSKYYPRFSQYENGDNLFKQDKRNILEYDFKIEKNEKAEKILKLIFSSDKSYTNICSEKCCIVKNTHHIFGKLFLYKKNNQNQKDKDFLLAFKRIINKENNKKEINNIKNKEESDTKPPSSSSSDFCLKSHNGNYCYGSIFECPERENDRTLIIKSKNIVFLVIRVYYHRVSAIEIFTINKSYYINFQNYFEISNIKTNKILNEIINNPFFKKIKIKNDKLIIGYYNIKYKPYLFPLFEDEINVWEKKLNYFNNYDLLTIINLFTNRSHRDVYQYPVFPMLYHLININRELNTHIGLQDKTNESIKRKDLFLKTFISNDEDREIHEDMCMFTIHYSNPAFIFNYLLRIMPFTFLSIEFQGDNFDDPNRLFFSVETALRSTLKIKSDLREMIPEFYYMLEIFYNKNNILFEKCSDGTYIDDVLILDKEKLTNDIEKRENFSKFVFDMRKNLEDRHINKWIDLIFGINQQNYQIAEDKQCKYYEGKSLTVFQTNPEEITNQLTMDMVSFGLVPYQLFNKKFPTITRKDKDIVTKINLLNKELFKDEHLRINSPIQTFLCKGRILIDDNYVKIINPKAQTNKLENYFNISESTEQKILKKLNNEINISNPFDYRNIEIEQYENSDKMSVVNYYFIGDIFGNILIYNLNNANIEENDIEEEYEIDEENKERNDYGSFEVMSEQEYKKLKENKKINNLIEFDERLKKKFNLEVKLYKQLSDHTKEIKYIDFNSRLNIFLSYSLDNFINIYIFPKLTLINAVDTISFKDQSDKNYFEKVVLISFPFPSIVCYNKEFIYILSINGDLIKYNKLEEGDKIEISIDKNLGIVEDKVEIFNSGGKLKKTFNFY